MDLRTTYLGMELKHPLMPGASPLVDDLDMVKRLEDAGASAIVMHSLFEEQIVAEQMGFQRVRDGNEDSFSEAASFLPSPDSFRLGPHEYLDHLAQVKKSVGVPVIGSLNGSTPGGWLEYAGLIEQAGADALELNVYMVPTDVEEPGSAVEDRVVGMVKEVKGKVKIPVAVKLSPFFTSLPHVAKRLEKAGADGLVVLNRFYQPDLDVENLEVSRVLRLSTPAELNLRLRTLALLSGRVTTSLALTGGVHGGIDALKGVMCGAHAVQMVSALLKRGPGVLSSARDEMEEWLEEHEYHSLRQAQGSMSLLKCPNPHAYERGNYVLVLQGWRGEVPGPELRPGS